MEAGNQNRRKPQYAIPYQKWDSIFGEYSELRIGAKLSIIIFEQMFVYDTESRKGNGTMSENELVLINRIREIGDTEEALRIAIATLEELLKKER